MRAQYKVLAEKYNLVNESISKTMKQLFIRLFDDLLKATSLKEYINTIQSSPLFPGMLNKGQAYGLNLGYAEAIESYPYLKALPASKNFFPADALFYNAVTIATAYAQQDMWHKINPNENPPRQFLPSAKLAWNAWWEYYEPIKKAADAMQDASKKADVNLDI
jgi:hypothetical protein